MKKIDRIIAFLLLLVPVCVYANDPHWEYDSYSFQYDMSMYISIHQQGVETDQWDNLELAAFCNDECRGIAEVGLVSAGPKYYYLRVRSNVSSGETISFKCYDKTNDKEIAFLETVTFESLKRYGYPSDPYILNLPVLSVTGVALNKSSLILEEEQTEQLTATVSPSNADNKKVNWSSSNASVATVSATGLVTAKAIGTATITVTTEDGNYTATATVIVTQKGITVEEGEPAGANGIGKIFVWLNVPTDALFTGSFVLKLPAGFHLDADASKLAGDLGLNLALLITQNADGSWLFTISTKSSANEVNPYRKIVEIIYTIDDTIADGDYEALVSDVDITLDNDVKIEEELITVKITVDHDYVGISAVNQETQVYVANHTLYVKKAAAETVNIYSVAGTCLHRKEKGVGTLVIPLNTQEKILIVKGSSGWVRKIRN
jgi:hypothetical protein